MASQTTKSALGGMLRKHATDKTEQPADYTNLPGGIDDGIAQIVVATIGEYKTGQMKGEKFMRLAANTLEPRTVVEIKRMYDPKAIDPRTKRVGTVVIVSQKERRVEGLQTKMMFPLCDSGWDDVKKMFTVDADTNIQAALNMLRLVANDDDFTADITTEDVLAEKLKMLVEVGPFIRFSTRDGTPNERYPTPMTFETWYGGKGLENYVPPVVGQTAGKATMATTPPTGNGHAAQAQHTTSPQENHEPAPRDDRDKQAEYAKMYGKSDPVGDMAALADAAEAGDEGARQHLLDMAISLGIDEATLSGVSTFKEVYDMIQHVQGAAAPATAPEENKATAGPHVGQRAYYKISAAMKRGIEVEVTEVMLDRGKVKAKNVSNPKMVYTVPFDRLDNAPE